MALLSLLRLIRAGLVVLLLPTLAWCQAPLHERIDAALTTATKDFAKKAAPSATDAEFLRRVYLDLTGTLPTADTVRAFLKDTTPDKRATVIDQLLASPEHSRYLAHVLDVWLMERRPDKHVPRAAWLDYLRTSVAANKPWDVLAREIAGTDGADPKTRPAAKFFLERECEPNLVTRDLSRLFLGMNLQCAQCHDHPLVEEYKQDYYYGIFAFVSRSSVVADPTSKTGVLSEKADGEVTFQSVFDKTKTTKSSLPRMLDNPAIKDATIEKGKEYVVAPAKGARSVPTYSRRSKLGEQLTAASTIAFRRNLANRLWAVMMGRGLIHPLDMDHPANAPSHPELLTLLADEVAATKYDMRAFLKQLALTKAYQRSSEAPAGTGEPDRTRYTVALLKPLTPEQLAFSLQQATGFTDAERKGLGTKADEAALYARVAPNLTPFLTTYGGAPGTAQNFEATLDQALFLANGALVRGWLAPRAGNLTDRLSRLTKPEEQADEIYLSVYSRLPADDERQELVRYLSARTADRPKAIEEIVWAMLASLEFRFNH